VTSPGDEDLVEIMPLNSMSKQLAHLSGNRMMKEDRCLPKAIESAIHA
jgi:hypothetical protein